ncbi:MAG: hypothetical protein AB1631_22820, partial [Acidobacteriota bacterium]
MFRVRRDPMWLVLIVVPILVWGLIADAPHRGSYLFWLAASGVLVTLRLMFWLFKRTIGMPVPDSAVRELLDRCAKDGRGEEWILVRFRPKVS